MSVIMNKIATVTLYGLKCNTTVNITARTLFGNRTAEGPNFSAGSFMIALCPPTAAAKDDNGKKIVMVIVCLHWSHPHN